MKVMQGCAIAGGGLLLVLLMMGGCLVASYNGIATGNQSCDAQWANVENAYQRRADLIPNLVETVKGSAKFEHDTLKDVIEARRQVVEVKVKSDDPESFKKFESAQAGLSVAMHNMMNFVREKYPDLKTVTAFVGLLAQLEGTENRCSVERRKFNETVLDYNGKIVSWPSSMLAGWGGFKARPYFQAEEGAKKAPKVDFSTSPASK
jgi:LemA protein